MPIVALLSKVRNGLTAGIFAGALMVIAVGCSVHSQHSKTAKHSLSPKGKIRVNVWLNPETGKIASCKLLDPTGDPAMDNEIEAAVLTSIDLPPLSPDLPMPITLRLTAQRVDDPAPLRRFTIASE